MLQHALYGVAAATLLRRLEEKPMIARGVYEFPSARGGGEREVKVPPSHGALAQVLSDLFDVMARGGFVSTERRKTCEYCDLQRACGMPVSQAAAKIANPVNAALEPFKRLRDHE
jgi:hypothetical protein